jgi:hypothetical protein
LDARVSVPERLRLLASIPLLLFVNVPGVIVCLVFLL